MNLQTSCNPHVVQISAPGVNSPKIPLDGLGGVTLAQSPVS